MGFLYFIQKEKIIRTLAEEGAKLIPLKFFSWSLVAMQILFDLPGAQKKNFRKNINSDEIYHPPDHVSEKEMKK